MLAPMASQSANSSPGVNYWFGSNSLPGALEGSAQERQNQNSRAAHRASEAVVQAAGYHSRESANWSRSQSPLRIDTNQANLVIRPPQDPSSASSSTCAAAAASALHKAPLAPKQGLGSTLADARAAQQSPIAGNYALRTPRGKITSIACESCRKRKSKCDGIRPKCATCQSKNLACVYDLAEDGKTTTQLRALVRRLAKELEDMKSIVPLLAMSSDRASAASWASELARNGFSHHTVQEVRQALSCSATATPAPPDRETFGTPATDHFAGLSRDIDTSSYGSSSREQSREQSQAAMKNPPIDHETSANALNKFNYDCAYYQRRKNDSLQNGWTEEQVFGRLELDVDALLIGFSDPQESQPVSTWCARTVNRVLPTMPLPVRLASMYVLTKVMRYLVWPSVENLNAHPEWLMSTVKPEATPHDVLIDLIPWPSVRQLLYQHPQEYPVAALVGLVGVAWPYTDSACHYWDMENSCSRLTPHFESTVADLNSWTIDPKFLDTLPQFQGHIPVKCMN